MDNAQHGETKMLTTEQKRRINQAIAKCDAFIAKEEPRSADLRPAAVAQHLEFCKAHRAKLQNALATNTWVS